MTVCGVCAGRAQRAEKQLECQQADWEAREQVHQAEQERLQQRAGQAEVRLQQQVRDHNLQLEVARVSPTHTSPPMPPSCSLDLPFPPILIIL